MKPIYPIKISHDIIKDMSWVNNPEYAKYILHISNVCKTFPSLLIAYSADTDAEKFTNLISEDIIKLGINVFKPEYPVPLSALSYALTSRNIPLGIYIENDSSEVTMTFISTHGGLFDEQDLLTNYCPKSNKTGVIGNTDLLSSYVNNLKGFVDIFIEKGFCFSDFVCPFAELEQRLRDCSEFSLLFEKNPNGYKAIISKNGSKLKLYKSDSEIPTEEIAQVLCKYMKSERLCTGSILCPTESKNKFSEFGDLQGINGNCSDVCYNAAFSDLFLGWWNDGLITLQGSSCMGDGILAAIYFVEALRS